jgi:raffinose/stachyose/melibiose transport system substrate-binding protein
MKDHPNIKINIITAGGEQDYASALRAKMATNEKPDLILLEGPRDLIAWKDYVEDLSDQPWANDILDSIRPACSLNGKLSALAYGLVTYGLIYNKRIFNDAGINMSGVDTFDEIESAFKALKAKIDSGSMRAKYPLLEAVTEVPGKLTWVIAAQGPNGAIAKEIGNEFDVLSAENIKFTHANAYKEYLDMMVRYTKNASNPAALNAVDYSTVLGGGLSIERVAVIQMGQWIIPEVLAVNPELVEHLGLLPIPLKNVEEGNITVGVGGFMIVNKQSPENVKAAAKEYLNWWFNTKDGQKEYAKDVILPGLKHPPVAMTNQIAKEAKAYVDAGRTTPLVYVNFPSGFTDRFGAGIQSYWMKTKTWDQIIQDAVKDWAALRSE